MQSNRRGINRPAIPRPAEPARTPNITDQQSNPNQPDAGRRKGADDNALSGALISAPPVGQAAGRRRVLRARALGTGTAKGRTVFSKLLCFLVIAICASLPAVTPVCAQSPAAGPAALANGTWTVQGRGIPGTRCGHWFVRLTNAQGRLSGVVSLARSSVPIQNLELRPDGSFSGTTRAGVVGQPTRAPTK